MCQRAALPSARFLRAWLSAWKLASAPAKALPEKAAGVFCTVEMVQNTPDGYYEKVR